MIIAAELVVLAAILVASVLVLRRHAEFFEERVRQQDKAHEDRQTAVFKQQKAAQTAISQQQAAMRVLADQTRALHEDIRLMHQRVDAHFAHPAVKALTNEEGE